MDAIAVGSVWHLNHIPDSRFTVVKVGKGTVMVQPAKGLPFTLSKLQFLMCYQKVEERA